MFAADPDVMVDKLCIDRRGQHLDKVECGRDKHVL